MNKLIYYTLGLLSLFLFSYCSKNNNPSEPQLSNHITVDTLSTLDTTSTTPQTSHTKNQKVLMRFIIQVT